MLSSASAGCSSSPDVSAGSSDAAASSSAGAGTSTSSSASADSTAGSELSSPSLAGASLTTASTTGSWLAVSAVSGMAEESSPAASARSSAAISASGSAGDVGRSAGVTPVSDVDSVVAPVGSVTRLSAESSTAPCGDSPSDLRCGNRPPCFSCPAGDVVDAPGRRAASAPLPDLPSRSLRTAEKALRTTELPSSSGCDIHPALFLDRHCSQCTGTRPTFGQSPPRSVAPTLSNELAAGGVARTRSRAATMVR